MIHSTSPTAIGPRRTASRRVRFGEAIRELRQRQGLTIKEVSRRLGISPTAVTSWEKGVTSPRDRLVLRNLLVVVGASAEERSGVVALLGHPLLADEEAFATAAEPDYLAWMQARMDQIRALQTQIGQLQEEIGVVQAQIDTHWQVLADVANQRLLCTGAAVAGPERLSQ